jgi:hypothetical protein
MRNGLVPLQLCWAGSLGAMLLACSCIQTTGGELVSFQLDAVGTPAAAAFTSGRGYDVTLSRARLFVGAVYLNQTNPADWSLETSCVLPGIYAGEVRGSLSIDALDATPQPFDAPGAGTGSPVRAGELWLTDGDVNDSDSRKVILDVAGTATKGGMSWPFSAAFTIGANRKQPPRDSALPGSHPLCKERIVSPIPTELTLEEGGTLTLFVDPREWFQSVEFSELKGTELVDDYATAGQPEIALYNALRSAKGPYRFGWTP